MEFRFTELRAIGNVITGTVVDYSDVAQIGQLQERIEAGAFTVNPGLSLTVQHDRAMPVARLGGGLVLEDGTDAMRMTATITETPRGLQALADAREGLLQGLSVEMRVEGERVVGSVRTIVRATLFGLSLVDSPAYGRSTIEAREKMIRKPNRILFWL